MTVAESSRAAMLDAAERLMAERGIGAVSLREVLEASGQRNKSAAHYHFGSRNGLIQEIITTRMAPINDARSAMLDELEATDRPITTREIVLALVEPLAAATVRNPGSFYCRFLAHSRTDPVWADAVDQSEFGSAYRRWRTLLDRHLADVARELRTARIDRAVTTVILALARWEGSRAHPPLREARIEDLIDCVAAGLEAPLSHTTLQLLNSASTNRANRRRST